MPRWKELKRFCDRDGWELYKNTDHYFYRKKMIRILIIEDEKQADTDEAKWLKEHCHGYGFILRYPIGKTEETGIIFDRGIIGMWEKKLQRRLWSRESVLRNIWKIGIEIVI